jgi:hypothetical protein
MLGIEQGAYTVELTQKRDKVQSDHPDQENWKHLEGDQRLLQTQKAHKITGNQTKKSPNKTLERLPSGVANSSMGKNPPNLGLATRQSLDTLKDRNASILPQIQQKPNDS